MGKSTAGGDLECAQDRERFTGPGRDAVMSLRDAVEELAAATTPGGGLHEDADAGRPGRMVEGCVDGHRVNERIHGSNSLPGVVADGVSLALVG